MRKTRKAKAKQRFREVISKKTEGDDHNSIAAFPDFSPYMEAEGRRMWEANNEFKHSLEWDWVNKRMWSGLGISWQWGIKRNRAEMTKPYDILRMLTKFYYIDFQLNFYGLICKYFNAKMFLIIILSLNYWRNFLKRFFVEKIKRLVFVINSYF